jgi:FkbM family methyltransferase
MINEFYGQFDPKVDQIIRQYFPEKQNGKCIEVGATDGIHFSNTYHFELNGWECLCIEPVPETFKKLKSNRKNCLNLAVSSQNNENKNFELFTIHNVEQPHSAMSGLEVDEMLVNDLKKHYPTMERSTIQIETRRLDWCIQNYFNYKDIDFISIDTEGSELDVLKSFNINDYNIKLFIIENNYNSSEIEEYLNNHGWKKDQRSYVNDFYVKK